MQVFCGSLQGDRQNSRPPRYAVQCWQLLRFNDDGTTPTDNPFVDYPTTILWSKETGYVTSIWSLGHRNPLGIAQDLKGTLWVIEMGPLHGDELNLIRKGHNYGYPEVSDGDVRPPPNPRPQYPSG